MKNPINTFIIIVVVQLFYALSITLLSYAMPAESLNHVESFSELANNLDMQSVSTDLENSVTEQMNIPIIELGALVFYSGNILVDLLLNFFFAIPQMIGLLVNGFMMLFNIDSYIFAQVELFAGVLITALYFIGIIQLLNNIRSGSKIT